MGSETFIAKFTEIQQNVEQLLAQLQASEHDKFAAHLYRSACQRAGKSGKQIKRCVIASTTLRKSMPRKANRRWQELFPGGGPLFSIKGRGELFRNAIDC